MIGESSIGLDPLSAAAISMFSTGEDAFCSQPLTVSDIETSFENEHLFSELLANGGNEMMLTVKIPADDDTFVTDEKLHADGPFGKSVSSDCLRSMDTVVEPPMKSNFLDFPVLDFGAVYGMRRAFSEGDIKV